MMKKSECSAEEWEAYRAYQRQWRAANLDRAREREREAYQRRKDTHKEYRDRPEVKERKNALARAKHAAKKAAQAPRYTPQQMADRAERQRKTRTGMSTKDRAAALLAQNGVCAVCERPLTAKNMRADHCHDSGKPRGLLCHHCNVIEGMIRAMGFSPGQFGDRLAHYLAHPPFQKASG